MLLLLIALIKKAETDGQGERGEMEIYLHFIHLRTQ